MPRFNRSSLLAATFVIALAGRAYTNPVLPSTLTYTGYSVLNNQTVTLKDSSVGLSAETGGAGQVTFSGTNAQGDAVLSWCIDITDRLLNSGSFTTGTVLQGAFGQTANALLSHAASVLGTDTNASAAMQVALWQAEYGAGLTVWAPKAVLDLASTFLADVNDGTWTANSSLQLSVLDGGGSNQTQVTLTHVPEPASLGIIATALLAAGVLGRRALRRPAGARTA